MTQAARHLHVVDADTGELFQNGCPECARKDDELAGLHRQLNSLARKNTELRRDRTRQAYDHEMWDDAVWLFSRWQKLCNHPKSVFTADRFWQVAPFLTNPAYGLEMCERAVAGAWFDPNKRPRANGSTKRYDDWGLIFRDADHVEEFANRAPKGWQPTTREEEPDPNVST